MKTVDLRSDTVTKPGPEMLESMIKAEVGDDVLGDDPSVLELQRLGAKVFGKDAALFCPSGTMCNQIAINILTKPRDEVICSDYSHVYLYEGGGMAFNSQVSVRLLQGDRGRISEEQIKGAINPDNEHFPISSLVVLENTCNKGGGSIYDINEIAKISRFCKQEGLKLHLDGARLFNALTETKTDPKKIASFFDTISVCLSKGLGAPVGSLLIGNEEHIRKAVRVRKVFGGGMRQAGYLAAAGIYALNNNVGRLQKDHEHARILGNALSSHSGIKSVYPIDTNIIIFEPDQEWKSCTDLILEFEEKGIRGIAFGPNHIRWVTHLDITEEMIEYTSAIIQKMS